ncbi:MAG: hypothetical protein U1E56_08835 [Bauldia sp.]
MANGFHVIKTGGAKIGRQAMRVGLFSVVAGLALGQITAIAVAQGKGTYNLATTVYDTPLGTPITQLSPSDYTLASCGSNGGPPGARLAGFADFKKCAVEPDTGLREIWFMFDDEIAYTYRAVRDPTRAKVYDQNTMYDHAVISSFLVDSTGAIRGYRIVTDPREEASKRLTAFLTAEQMKAIAGDPQRSTCMSIPMAPGQDAVDGDFVNQECREQSATRVVNIITHLFRKPGQLAVDPVTGQRTDFFESQARLEMYDPRFSGK